MEPISLVPASAVSQPNRRMTPLWVAVLVVVGLPSLAQSATVCVPSSFDVACDSSELTIQDGIDAAVAGDTVWVDDGTYSEFLTLDKNIALLSRNGRALTTLSPPSNPASFLGTVRVTSATTGAQIGDTGQGFTIEGLDNASPAIESAALYFQGSHTGAIVRDNEIIADGDSALVTEFGAANDGFVIDGNTFSGTTFVGDPAGFGFSQQFTLPNVPRQLIVINGNAATNLSFTNNVVAGTTGGVNPDLTGTECPTLGETCDQGNTCATIDSSGAVVSGNSFACETTGLLTSQLRVRRPGTSVTGNDFSSAGLTREAVHVWLDNMGQTSGAIATGNSFDRGVFVDGTTGAIAHSVSLVLELVPLPSVIQVLPGLYSETAVLDQAHTLVATSPASEVNAGDASAQAILDGGGAQSVVTVLPGVDGATVEGFEITNPTCALTGDACHGIIVNSFSSGAATVSVDLLDNVVHDIGDPARTSTGNQGEYGILAQNVGSSTISGNTVYNLSDSVAPSAPGESPGSGRAQGIAVKQTNGVASGVTILGNTVHDVQDVGIRADAGSSPAIGVDIVDNVVSTIGSPGIGYLSGIGIDHVATGVVSGNTVSNVVGGFGLGIQASFTTTITGNVVSGVFGGNGAEAPPFPGSGLLINTGNVAVSLNQLLGNATGVAVVEASAGLTTNVTANQNCIDGNGVGLLNATTGAPNFLNNWWGSVTGPSNALGCPACVGGGDSVFNFPGVAVVTPFATSPNCGCTVDAECDDGIACNGTETCNTGSGICESAPPVDCTSFADQCNAGLCVEPAGTCVTDPLVDGTVCSTGLSCSIPDACEVGVCVSGGGGDDDNDGICNVNDQGGHSINLLRANVNLNHPDRDKFRVRGELDVGSEQADAFLAALATTGIEVQFIKDTPAPLTVVTGFTFTAGQCTETKARVQCFDSTTRTRLRLRKRVAPGFFRVALALKKLNYTKPLAAEGPFTVRFLTLQNGSLFDHSDQIGPVECEDRSTRFLRCRDDP